MIGKNPLWVAKQHGHSIATMLRAYAAWAEGSVGSDLTTIRNSMRLTPTPRALPASHSVELYDRQQSRSSEDSLLAINILAANLPAAEVIHRPCASASAVISAIG
jgi:hypothetical protein